MVIEQTFQLANKMRLTLRFEKGGISIIAFDSLEFRDDVFLNHLELQRISTLVRLDDEARALVEAGGWNITEEE